MSKVGPVAYRLKLPPELSRIHDTFHVSMLRKYIPDPSHVLREQPVRLKRNLTYDEIPVKIVDQKEQVLRSKVFSFPFSLVCSFWGRNVLWREDFVTLRPEIVYNTCDCRGAYVHQVPL